MAGYKNESEGFTSIAYFLITIFICFVHELLDVIVGNWLFDIILQLYSQEMFYFTETHITLSYPAYWRNGLVIQYKVSDDICHISTYCGHNIHIRTYIIMYIDDHTMC